MNYRKFFFTVISALFLCVVLIALAVYVIDPCFHYRRPAGWNSYALFSEAYQNDGIAKHFDYDAVIVGNSLAEGFKTSEADSLFGVKSVRLTAAGSSLSEHKDYLETAFSHNHGIRMVIWCLDYERIASETGEPRDSQPEYYLYDEDCFNDINYIFNKDILVAVIKVAWKSLMGLGPDSFDTFENWLDYEESGKAALDSCYTRSNSKTIDRTVVDGICPENIRTNVFPVIEAHPDTVFYLYLSPYFIYYFDDLNNKGTLNDKLAQERALFSELLEFDNVRLYSFNCNEALVTGYDNYVDLSHYTSRINSYILECMRNGEYRITKDNMEEYCAAERNFLFNYDYDSLFGQTPDRYDE